MSDKEKEDKPVKLFELKFEIWDDGQITNSITEIVPQERGAPKKWLLEPQDFVKSVSRQISTTPAESLGPVFLELIGLKQLAYSSKASESIKDAEFEDADEYADEFADD